MSALKLTLPSHVVDAMHRVSQARERWDRAAAAVIGDGTLSQEMIDDAKRFLAEFERQRATAYAMLENLVEAAQ